jgi:hypothetical protein
VKAVRVLSRIGPWLVMAIAVLTLIRLASGGHLDAVAQYIWMVVVVAQGVMVAAWQATSELWKRSAAGWRAVAAGWREIAENRDSRSTWPPPPEDGAGCG